MNLLISFFIGFRYFFSKSRTFLNKLTNILSIMSMSCGVSAVITIISIMNGFENEFKNRILNFIPHVIVSKNSNNMNKFSINKHDLVSKYVKKISEIIISDVIVQGNSEISIGSVLSMNHKQYNVFKPYLRNNSYLKILNKNNYDAIIGQGLANKLNIHIGDKFTLIFPNFRPFFLFKNITNRRIFKVIDTFITNTEIDSYQILVNHQDLSTFLCYPKDHITGLRLWLKDPLDIDNYLEHLHLPGIKIKNWKQSRGELLQAAKIENYMMIFLFSLIVMVSVFSLFVSISLFIMNKEKDIAIFQTLGLSKCNIMLVFIFQGMLSGIIGISLGTVLSFLIMNETIGIMSIIKLFFPNISLPYVIFPHQIITIDVISTIFILLSTVYPAWKATTIFPSRRLAYE
ncbi:MAG: FtsX-like permease family protein [Buchnera aphidicola (Kaburagia rhusicola ensigallis)]